MSGMVARDFLKIWGISCLPEFITVYDFIHGRFKKQPNSLILV